MIEEAEKAYDAIQIDANYEETLNNSGIKLSLRRK